MHATQSAIDEIKKAINSEISPKAGFRIFTQQGCCGPVLRMEVVEKPWMGDLQQSIDSVNFFLEDAARDILAGVTLDYGADGFTLEGLKRSSGCCG